jgi:hypothetical protein
VIFIVFAGKRGKGKAKPLLLKSKGKVKGGKNHISGGEVIAI